MKKAKTAAKKGGTRKPRAPARPVFACGSCGHEGPPPAEKPHICPNCHQASFEVKVEEGE